MKVMIKIGFLQFQLLGYSNHKFVIVSEIYGQIAPDIKRELPDFDNSLLWLFGIRNDLLKISEWPKQLKLASISHIF
jgi:hypothetical protein